MYCFGYSDGFASQRHHSLQGFELRSRQKPKRSAHLLAIIGSEVGRVHAQGKLSSTLDVSTLGETPSSSIMPIFCV
jgi:hypothetical protein